MKIIVTGSEGLIGQEVVKYLKNRPPYTVLPIDINQVDLVNEQAVKKFFSHKIHQEEVALVNCFALNDHIQSISTMNRLLDVTLDSFNEYLITNVTALFSVCREFMRTYERGSIVNFTSTYGIGSPRDDMYGEGEKHIGYGVSKAAVIQLTKHLATHWAPEMRVNCIAPGGIANGQPKEFKESYAKNTPMKRMGRVTEIAPLVEYLISHKSSYCTGGVYPVDGGWTAW